MKNLSIIIILFIGISCNSPKEEISLIGKWATIINSKDYYEININKKRFEYIDETGTQESWHGYKYESGNLFIPTGNYDVSYFGDKCHIAFSNNIDTLILEKINYDESKTSFSAFFFRKYNFLVSKGIVSADSALNFFWDMKNRVDTTHYDIIEY